VTAAPQPPTETTPVEPLAAETTPIQPLAAETTPIQPPAETAPTQPLVADTLTPPSAETTPVQPPAETAPSQPLAAGTTPAVQQTLSTTAIQPAPAPSPERTEVGVEAPPAEEDGGTYEHTGVELRIQSGIVQRSLEFTQDVYHRMRTLNASAYVYRLDAAVYPSFRSLPLGGHVGLIASYEGTLGGRVDDTDFRLRYPISHSELFGGIRLRRPVYQHELGFDLTVGRLKSGLDDGNDVAGVPDITYSEIRTSIDYTLHFGRINATVAAGFRVPFGYGDIGNADWFPRLGGYGLEAALKGSYLVAAGISVEASATLRRYTLEMNSQPEDAGSGRAEVAGGAIDSYLGGYVGVNFVL